jgi:uncharacterized Ntn-hydrolase superfamily protein
MTYSVVARDPETGMLGVACQSHFFAVAGAVNWAQAGVGAVATQSFVEPAYGARGLELLRTGKGAQGALDAVLAADSNPELRQVAMVSASGDLAVHTGARCVGFHGSRTGSFYSVQGNMLSGADVLDAMAEAVERPAPFPDRLLAALRAADAVGGDLRGRQAAGIRIVAAEPAPVPWGGTLLDLRVEDAPDPVGELTRLVHQAELAGVVVGSLFTPGLLFGSSDLLEPGFAEAAVARLADVAAQDGEVGVEAELWRGVLLARAGNAEAAAAAVKSAVARRPGLERLLANLAEAGYLAPELTGSAA